MTPVTIYTVRSCGYCVAAKRLLDDLGAAYREIGLDGDPELRRRVSAENGNWPTVPMVFVGETFVGGYSDLKKLHQEGRLEPWLAGEG